ncbi:MAG: response regulator [Cyanobacteria bacterium P01_D01_bin.156]
MQGQLSELDIRSIFQLIDIGQQTGELYVDSFNGQGHPTSWLIFFANGGILYAGRTDEQLERLRESLASYKLSIDWKSIDLANLAPLRPPEYGALWWLLENNVVTPQQARSTLYRLVEETLFEVVSLHQGQFYFHFHASLSPQLTKFSIAPFIKQVTRQLQGWLKLQPHISSIYDCPVATERLAMDKPLSSTSLMSKADGKTSILRLSRQFHRTIFSIAEELYPHIQSGKVQLINIPKPAPQQKINGASHKAVPRIVCIDDTPTIRQTIEAILDTHGYEVTSIARPSKALSLLFSLKPDLILCDVAMPELEGHQLCAMLRQAPHFQSVPIIMLTGKDSFVDRVKANMAGATDYLTKPFDDLELLTLVEKYVGRGNPTRLAPETLLEQEISAALNPESWSGSGT